MSNLEIVYRDQYLVAINKPHGLLVHRSKYADEANVFAVQELRNQIDLHVYPCHRLDRKTSGVLLFALNKEVNSLMQNDFAENKVKKSYLAIVRGYAPHKGTIDYALSNETGKVQEALTNYCCLDQSEMDLPFGKFNTSRYSLLEVKPESGRMHQIRKHMAHIFHPIIGDRPHGCNKQNKLWKEKFNMTTMMLHARELNFTHPVTKEDLTIEASPSEEMLRTLEVMGMKAP